MSTPFSSKIWENSGTWWYSEEGKNNVEREG